MTSQTDYYVTVQELADEWRMSIEGLYRWRTLDRGPKSIRRGKRILYRRSDIDAWVSQQDAATARGGAA